MINSAHQSATQQVVVIGAGQAGLSVTQALQQHGLSPSSRHERRLAEEAAALAAE